MGQSGLVRFFLVTPAAPLLLLWLALRGAALWKRVELELPCPATSMLVLELLVGVLSALLACAALLDVFV